MPLPQMAPYDVRPLFPRERAALLELLRGLSAEDWKRPTVCPDWNVKAAALHILDGDLGWLSRGRDGDLTGLLHRADNYWAFLQALNQKNQRWVEAAVGLSPRVICDLLEFSGKQVDAYYATIELDIDGGGVSWAGLDSAPEWLNLGRDFTERWVHQQQIRDAVNRPGLKEAEWLSAVLRVFVWALPHHYHSMVANSGTKLAVKIDGPGGGEWTLTKTNGDWDLEEVGSAAGTATVELSSDDVWRLFTGALADTSRINTAGDGRLAAHFFGTRSIIV